MGCQTGDGERRFKGEVFTASERFAKQFQRIMWSNEEIE